MSSSSSSMEDAPDSSSSPSSPPLPPQGESEDSEDNTEEVLRELNSAEDNSNMADAEDEDKKSSSSSSVSMKFAPLKGPSASSPLVGESFQRIGVPPHRYTPLKEHWMEIYTPICEHMNIQIRFNPKMRAVELRSSSLTESPTALQKSCDFIRAFCLGFEIRDAIALLRLDDIFIDSFEVKDVKSLSGEHLSRAIGRIAGQGGKTKFTIENATKTRIVLADQHVHILGSFNNINIAKTALVKLIIGSPPGKVYTQMRAVAARSKDKF